MVAGTANWREMENRRRLMGILMRNSMMLEHFNFEMLCGRAADTREACHFILSITWGYVKLPMYVVQ